MCMLRYQQLRFPASKERRLLCCQWVDERNASLTAEPYIANSRHTLYRRESRVIVEVQ